MTKDISNNYKDSNPNDNKAHRSNLKYKTQHEDQPPSATQAPSGTIHVDHHYSPLPVIAIDCAMFSELIRTESAGPHQQEKDVVHQQEQET